MKNIQKFANNLMLVLAFISTCLWTAQARNPTEIKAHSGMQFQTKDVGQAVANSIAASSAFAKAGLEFIPSNDEVFKARYKKLHHVGFFGILGRVVLGTLAAVGVLGSGAVVFLGVGVVIENSSSHINGTTTVPVRFARKDRSGYDYAELQCAYSFSKKTHVLEVFANHCTTDGYTNAELSDLNSVKELSWPSHVDPDHKIYGERSYVKFTDATYLVNKKLCFNCKCQRQGCSSI